MSKYNGPGVETKLAFLGLSSWLACWNAGSKGREGDGIGEVIRSLHDMSLKGS